MNKDDQELSALYKSQALEQPSPEIDQKILAQAKADAKINNKPRVKLYNYVPFSVAASMAIAALLFFSFPEFYQLKQPPQLPEMETEFIPPPLPQQLKNQPAALSSPAADITNQRGSNDQGTPAVAAPKSAVIERMADEAVQRRKSSNLSKTAPPKESFSTETSIGITELSKAQLDTLDSLLEENKTGQAIKFLKQLQQRHPQLILPEKYQQLLTQANKKQ